MLELQPHQDAVLQAVHHQQHQQEHITTLPVPQPPSLQLLLRMAAEASWDQLQELLLRLLQITAGRRKDPRCSSSSAAAAQREVEAAASSSNVVEGAAVAMCYLCWCAGPHAYSCGLILCQPRSRQLLQDACRNSSSSFVAAVADDLLSRPVEQLLQPALYAFPHQVGAAYCAVTL